jgi:patatin-like phospholipase
MDSAAQFERDVFPAELDEIAARRKALGQAVPPSGGGPVAEKGLVGLAFSGGGIRSATLGLGAIQALSQYGAFPSFDYLSTVSGGGFVGGCVSSLMNDTTVRSDDRTFPMRAVTGANEPPAVRHLRNSGNYLAPGGFLDKVRIPALMVRGIMLNLFAILPYLMLAAVVTQYCYDNDLEQTHPSMAGLLFFTVQVLPVTAFVLALLLFPLVTRVFGNRLSWSARNTVATVMTVVFLIFAVWLVHTPFVSLVTWSVDTSFTAFLDRVSATLADPSFRWRALATLVAIGIVAVAAGFSPAATKIRGVVSLYFVGLLGPVIVVAAYLLICMVYIDSHQLQTIVQQMPATPRALRDLDAGLVPPELARESPRLHGSGGAATRQHKAGERVADSGVVFQIVERDGGRRAWIEAAGLPVGQSDAASRELDAGRMPSALANLSFLDNRMEPLSLDQTAVQVRTAGREWIAKHPNGIVFAIVRGEDTLNIHWELAEPPSLVNHPPHLGERAHVVPVERGKRWTLISSGSMYEIDHAEDTLIVQADLGADLNRGLTTSAVHTAFADKGGLSDRAVVSSGAVRGMLGDAGFMWRGPEATHEWFLSDSGVAQPISIRRATGGYMTDKRPPFMGTLADRIFLGFAVAWILFNAAFVNVNASSIHDFYRDRLSKAYLLKRDPTSGDLVQNDRQRLAALRQPGTVAPYHLINVSLNLNGSTEPDMRGRNCDFFIFSKHFTGSVRTGYCKTADLERIHRHLDLGTAMAISGAAAAPNAGTTTIKPLTFLLTLFNIRLGYWMPHPAYVSASWWQRVRLSFGVGPRYLWREAMGSLTTNQPYVNLSDGGHIENLGLYGLLKRRCKVIVAVDGEQDEQLRFGSLMQLLMYARIDLGADIAIDLDAIRAKAGLSQSHHTIGRITYCDGQEGWLVYAKASITGDEGPLVLDYRESNPDFPHQTTANQFFTERQFEMYRALGYHIIEDVCIDIVKHKEITQALFRESEAVVA